VSRTTVYRTLQRDTVTAEQDRRYSPSRAFAVPATSPARLRLVTRSFRHPRGLALITQRDCPEIDRFSTGRIRQRLAGAVLTAPGQPGG
jgi:hypothetical protein